MNRNMIVLAASAVLAIATVKSFGDPAVGDTVDFKTWFSTATTSPGIGLVEKGTIDTVRTLPTAHEYVVMVKAANNPAWWQPTLPAGGIRVRMTTSLGKPAAIEACSPKFQSCTWLTGVFSDFAFVGNRKFFFPVLPAVQTYNHGDFFRVRISDTVGVACTLVTFDSTTFFYGKLLRYSNADDNSGTPVSMSDPLRMDVSAANPFRFGGIVAHSGAGPLLGMDLTCCGTGYYGLDIAAYRPKIPLSVVAPLSYRGRSKTTKSSSSRDLLGRMLRETKSTKAFARPIAAK